ncbi:MAG: Uma2 family endonuclease, partial [Cyanobacteria bacterium J06598_1]
SLEEYVLINTKYKRVEVFRRSNGGLWVLQVYQEESENDEAIIELKSVGLKVSLPELYEDVQLDKIDVESSV